MFCLGYEQLNGADHDGQRKRQFLVGRRLTICGP